MSEYTPTTEQVRAGYTDWTVGKASEFDRWLAEHDREVAARAWSEGFDNALSLWTDWNMKHSIGIPGVPVINPYQEDK